MTESISDGWKLVSVQDITTVLRGSSPRPKSDPRYYGGEVPRLMVADISRDGKYVTPRIDSLTREGAKFSRPVQRGTLTIVCSGVTTGDSSILAVDACIHDGLLALVDYSPEVNVEFLYYTFQWRKHQLFNNATHGGAYTNLTTQILKEFNFPIPPISEQRKIAEILSAWDEAITKTESLITTLYERKIGLMQHLLTGRARFSGFEDKWQELKLSDICSKRKGKIIATNTDRIGLPYIGSTSFMGDFSLFSTDKSGVRCYPTDILILWDGEYAGKTSTGLDGYASSTVAVLKLDKDKVNNYFVNFYLEFLNRYIRSIAEGSGIPHMPGDLLDWLKLKTPSLVEQKRIAQVLQDCDIEINLYSKRLKLMKKQKKGLMQKLLTGQIRIKV